MSNSVTAKFTVSSVTNYPTGSSIQMEPVRSGSPENEQFYAYTPAGNITLQTVNSEAAAVFIPGQEYYVTIRPATVAGQ